VGFLVVLEVVLRVTAPIYGRQLFDNDYTGSRPIEMNAEGYRGPLIPKDRQRGELRVLGLGDSVTYGTGIGTRDAWPYQLESALHPRDARVVAINGGVQGSSLGDIVRAWDEQWLAYRPDVVVLALTGNMVSLEVVRSGKTTLPREVYAELHRPLSTARQTTLEAGRLMHRLCLPSFLSLESQRLLYWNGLLTHDIDARAPYGAVLAHGWRQGDFDPGLAEAAWGRLAGLIEQLDARVRASGATLVLTYVPPRLMLSDSQWDNEKNIPVGRFSIDPLTRASKIAGDLHIRYVDAREALLAGRRRIALEQSRRAPMYIFFDYQHPDEDGHRAIAEAIAADLGQ
jgi:lysophospholipase L1-like esterase